MRQSVNYESLTIGSLVNGQTYQVEVFACNNYGCSPASSVSATPAAPTATPQRHRNAHARSPYRHADCHEHACRNWDAHTHRRNSRYVDIHANCHFNRYRHFYGYGMYQRARRTH